MTTRFWDDPIQWFQDIEMLSPQRLWWLLGLLVLLGLYLFVQWRRREMAVRFTNVDLIDTIAPERLNWRRHLPALLLLTGLGTGIFAWAEPARVEEVPSERATIIMAIDTSLSMMARDVDPSRIDGAKEAAIAFVEDLPDQLNVGLVSFNGIASIRVAPTTNRVAVVRAIDDLELGEATAIGEAVFAGLQAIDDMLPGADGTIPPARIVVMSDGETTVGRSDEDAVEAARQAAIPVSTISFGTDSGFIVLEGESSPIAVPVNRDALALIADETGGEFFSAVTTDELREVYEDIGSQMGVDELKVPITDTFVGLALLLIAAAAALSIVWTNRLP